MNIPNYYFNKKARERKTFLIERDIYKICDIIFKRSDPEESEEKLISRRLRNLIEKKYKPRFFDDTKFVVVSRIHVLITAISVAIEKDAVFKNDQRILINFLKQQYIPFCRSLQSNIFHRFSNHGALGLMGEIIAFSFIMQYDNSCLEKRYAKKRLNELSKKLQKRTEYSILKKKCFFGNKGEFWIENLRNTKGLYYTFLHLSALTRAFFCLKNANIVVSDKCFSELESAFNKYKYYYLNPKYWPYKNKTKIPVLRQLQELIFPSGGEYIHPRKEGKEGAFFIMAQIIFCKKHSLDILSSYKVIAPFSYSAFFVKNPKFQKFL